MPTVTDSGWRDNLLLLAPAIYLFVLPLPHVTAIRSISFGVAVLLLLWTWRAAAGPEIPLKAAFAIWFGLAVATLFWAVHPEYSIGEIRVEIVYGFLAFLIFFKATRTLHQLRIWLVVLWTSGLVTCIFALLHFLSGYRPYNVGFLYGGALSYAGYVTTVLPFLVAMAILTAGYLRAGLIGLILLMLLVAFGTTNRGVWLYLLAELTIFGGLYLFRMDLKPQTRKATVAFMAIAAVLSVATLLVAAKERLELAGGPAAIIVGTAKADLRPALWRDTVTIWIAQRPITGAGFGTMVLGEELQEQQKNLNHTHAHNILLNYALQLGLAGPFVLAFLFYSVGLEFWKLTKASDRELQILGIAGMAMLSGILASGMIEDLFGRHLGWLFWAVVGMILGYAKSKAVGRDASWHDPRPTIAQGP